MKENHKNRVIKEFGINTEVVKVKTCSFDNLMKNYPNVKHIDYLSLDVEGVELDVLKTIDFNKYKFSIMTIENNEKENVLEDFMRLKGYKPLYVSEYSCDIYFIPM